MRIRGTSFFLRWTSLLFVILTVVLTVTQLVQYSVSRGNYPPSMTIAGVPVGGLNPQATAQRLLQVYSTPVELHYGNAVIQLDPALVGFELNTESMLAAADLQRTGASFWGGFWNYLWGHWSAGTDIPLVATYSEERLRFYLTNEISARYDQLPTPAEPVPGSANFTSGTPGQILDIDRAVPLIESALNSPTARVVMFSSKAAAASRPSMQTLQIMLQQIIDQNLFDGILGFYLLDLQTGEELNFGYQTGQNLPVNPDIAFTASSTIKIPIMVSIYRHRNSQLDDQTAELVHKMIGASDPPSSDAVMSAIDEVRGPLVVYEDMKVLGLQNTYIAGFFCSAESPCPLLAHISTPSNQRIDISTEPDPYNQTTPSDMGMLLEDIYFCSETGGGALIAAFPGQIDQTGCQQMIQYLEEDKLGLLIQAGVPEGTTVAHKHGWVPDTDNTLRDVSDAAIVYTPGGNYVLSIYAYHPTQIIWEYPDTRLGVGRMFADMSRAVYNYFNLPTP